MLMPSPASPFSMVCFCVFFACVFPLGVCLLFLFSNVRKIPIFHCNGDDPMSVCTAFELAVEWRQQVR